MRRLLRIGDLTRVRRGSYVAGPLPEEPVRRHRLAIAAAAEVLAEEAVVSHASAAVLHGLPLWNVPLGRVHVTRARSSGGRRGRIVHVHVAPLHPGEIALVDGVAVTAVARTLVDVARTSRSSRPSSRWTRRWPEGSSTGRSWPKRCCAPPDGSAARRRVVRSRSPIRVPRASGSRAAGLRSRGRACPGRCCSGRSPTIGRTDFGWPSLGAVGEFDGEVKYGRLLRAGQSPGDVVFAEKVREDRIRATGLGMARWTWDELGPAFAPVAARIRAHFRGSRTSGRAHAHRGQYA